LAVSTAKVIKSSTNVFSLFTRGQGFRSHVATLDDGVAGQYPQGGGISRPFA